MKKIFADKHRLHRLCVILFFAGLLIYGCLAFRDYGISVDENVERNSTLVTYKYLMPSVSDIVTDSVNFQEIEDLDTYTDRYYGVAVQLPMAVIEHLFGFELPLRTVYLIRHFYTFALFFLAAVVFYFLGKRLTGSPWGALLGTAMLVISPRMLAESFYNIKDIVFLSFVIYNLYAAAVFLDKPSVKHGVILAVVSALCTNVRIVGAVVIASCMLVSLIQGIVQKQAGRRFLAAAGVSVLCIGLYILSMPVLWKDPVGELIQTVKTFSDFTNWDDIFLYRGFAVRGNDLPRSYIFVWIFISTPLIYLALFAVGIIGKFAGWLQGLYRAVTKKEELPADFWQHILFGLVLVIPLAYVVLRKPTLYNGWRHFYFLYAVIMIYAMEGGLLLLRGTGKAGKAGHWLQAVSGGAIACGMGLTLGWMIVSHPYEYMYFNPLVRNYALYNFELDYWAVSEMDMLQYICDHDDRDEIRVWCTASDFNKSVLMLSEADRQRLVYVSSPMEADYAVCRDLMKTSVEQMERQFAFEEIYSAEVDGRTINSVFMRTDELGAESTVAWTGEGLSYSAASISWSLEEEAGKTVLVSDLGTEVSLTKVSVRGDSQDYLRGLRLEISQDGERWTEARPAERNDDYILYNKKAVFECEGEVRYLRLTHVDGLERPEEGQLVLETELFLPLGVQAELSSPQIVERVSGHENPVASVNTIDGNLLTRWQSEDVQKEGIAFDIVLNDVYTLSGIRLDTGESPNEYPRKLRIFVTADEVNWTEVEAETADQILFTFPESEVKMIRLLTGNMDGMDVQDRWSIYEITLMQAAG